jgi:hypothetical protein
MAGYEESWRGYIENNESKPVLADKMDNIAKCRKALKSEWIYQLWWMDSYAPLDDVLINVLVINEKYIQN